MVGSQVMGMNWEYQGLGMWDYRTKESYYQIWQIWWMDCLETRSMGESTTIFQNLDSIVTAGEALWFQCSSKDGFSYGQRVLALGVLHSFFLYILISYLGASQIGQREVFAADFSRPQTSLGVSSQGRYLRFGFSFFTSLTGYSFGFLWIGWLQFLGTGMLQFLGAAFGQMFTYRLDNSYFLGFRSTYDKFSLGWWRYLSLWDVQSLLKMAIASFLCNFIGLQVLSS